MGGVKTLKAVSAPYRMVRFIPTGGISPANLGEYLKQSMVLACGGSWMVSGDLIRESQFDRITELAREAVMIADDARG
jgi:2-dehydro-3-deoxyphosphogluconate aldolase/(4S)-4-hydroxy-2-oxoglutarate aldolase